MTENAVDQFTGKVKKAYVLERAAYFIQNKNEIRRLEMELKQKSGKLDQEFGELLTVLGVPSGSHLVDVVVAAANLE